MKDCLDRNVFEHFGDICPETMFIIQQYNLCTRPYPDFGFIIPSNHRQLLTNLFLDIIQEFNFILRTTNPARQHFQHVAILHDHNSLIGG